MNRKRDCGPCFPKFVLSNMGATCRVCRSCRGTAGIDRSTVVGAINAIWRARGDDYPFLRVVYARTRASVCAIETVLETACERVREAAHGVFIGAIPDLGLAV
jgi:hypothetical protein